ncbi:hypothetical protein [Novosphingobium lindaniclasticum]
MTMMAMPRRALLVGAALLLAGGNLWWFTRGKQAPEPDFVLGTTWEQVEITADVLPSLPRFDVVHGAWSARGRPISAIGDRVRPFHGDDVISELKPRSYLAIAIAADEGPQELRPMLLDLARASICDVAVVPDGMKPGPRGGVYVDIQHIVSVRDERGKAQDCIAAQRAAAPSSASR